MKIRQVIEIEGPAEWVMGYLNRHTVHPLYPVYTEGIGKTIRLIELEVIGETLYPVRSTQIEDEQS